MAQCGKQSAADKQAAAEKEQKESTETASGIARFRPCENWSGEYGFDWVREKEDVFKEKLTTNKDDFGKASPFIVESFLENKLGKTDKGKKELKKWREENSKDTWIKQQLERKKEIPSIQERIKVLEKKELSPEKLQKLNWENPDDVLALKENMELATKRKDLEKIQRITDAIENHRDDIIQKEYDVDYFYACLDKISDYNPTGSDQKFVDQEAWLSKKNRYDPFSEEAGHTEADETFEYCYQSTDVHEVVYKSYGNGFWTRDLLGYKDKNNGDDAAKKSQQKLNAFIDPKVGGGLSCRKEGNTISIPIYCENAENDETWTTGQKNTQYYLLDKREDEKYNKYDGKKLSAKDIVLYCSKINDEESKMIYPASEKCGFLSIDGVCKQKVHDIGLIFSNFSALEPLLHFKRITFVKDKKHYNLTYRRIEGKQFLLAVIDDCSGLFIDGTLAEVKLSYKKKVKDKNKKIKEKPVTDWVSYESAMKHAELSEKASKIGDMLKSCLDTNWLLNKEKRIDYLSKDGSLQNLKILIKCPQNIEYLNADIKEEQIGYSHVKKLFYYPGNGEDKYEVVEWNDAYQRSFGTQRISIKDKIYRYCFPVLSMPLWQEKTGAPDYQSLDERKKIESRSLYDAPKIIDNDPDVKPNEYKIQLFYEQLCGSCHKLRVESSCPMVSIQAEGSAGFEPMVFLDPNKKSQSLRLKISPCTTKCEETCKAFNGKNDKDFFRYYESTLTAYSLTKNDFENDKEKKGLFAGKMVVRLHIPCIYPIFVFKAVPKKGETIPDALNKTLNEQITMAKNILPQVGIVPKFIFLDQIVVSGFLNKNKILPSDKNIYAKFVQEVDEQLKQNRTLFDSLHHFLLVFVINYGLSGQNIAFRVSGGGIPYKGREYPSIFIGKTFSTVRGQVSTLTHEVLHALGLPHSFQLYGAYENKFCLPFAQTTNIMDYNTIAYSLRQYQWEVMREEAYQPCKEYYKLTHQKKQ